MKKKLNIKKSWPFMLLLAIMFNLALGFVIGLDYVSTVDSSVLDQVVGTVYGIDLTYRIMAVFIAFYSAMTLLFFISYNIIKWCINNIVVE